MISESASETLTILILAYGENAMMKSSDSEWREDVQDDHGIWEQETQRTDANEHRVWALVGSDQRLGMRLMAGLEYEQGNRGTEYYGGFGNEKNSTKMVSPILSVSRNNLGFTFCLIFTQYRYV